MAELVQKTRWQSFLATAWGVWSLALVLLSSRPAWASTSSEEGSFRGVFASLSATMMATLDLAQSKEEVPLSVALPDAEPRREAPPSWMMVGFCDERGASAVAPLPTLPVGDGKVAAQEDPCQGPTWRGGKAFQQGKNAEATSGSDAIDLVLLPPVMMLPQPASWASPAPRAPALQTPRRGFARGLDEPPRG